MAAAAGIHAIDWAYVDHLTNISDGEASSSSGLSIGFILLVLYLGVTLVFMGFSMYRFGLLYSTTRHARQVTDGNVKVFLLDKRVGSFTFFRHIY